jgi:hypothetical protein
MSPKDFSDPKKRPQHIYFHYPKGIQPLNEAKVAQEGKIEQEWIKGLRGKLGDLLSMVNSGGWKYLKHIKDAAIYTRESERGIV